MARHCKPSKCPSKGDWGNKRWYGRFSPQKYHYFLWKRSIAQGWYHVAIKCPGFGSRVPEFKPWFYHLLAVWSWNVIYFAICKIDNNSKVGMITDNNLLDWVLWELNELMWCLFFRSQWMLDVIMFVARDHWPQHDIISDKLQCQVHYDSFYKKAIYMWEHTHKR